MKKPQPQSPWNDGMYVKAFCLAREGMSGEELATGLGVKYENMRKWKQKNEHFRAAIEEGRAIYRRATGQDKSETFMDYVYERLTPELQRLWDKMSALENEPNIVLKIEKMLANQGLWARMHLFVHALIKYNFNASAACRSLNMPTQQFFHWVKKYPEFGRLIEEVEYHRKNFYEAALVKLVKDGDVAATIFVNKTLNRDRGYNDKHEIEIRGNINHSHSLIDVESLDLDLETKLKILDAVERQKLKRQQSDDDFMRSQGLGMIVEGEVKKIEETDRKSA